MSWADAGVSDHGALSGLTDDDHTQYVLASGTRAFSGNVDAGTNKVVNVVDPTSAQDAATKAYVDANSGASDHGALSGLTDDDHSQYALLAGRSGGQMLYGGTGSSDDLTLRSTSNATLGNIFLHDSGILDADKAGDALRTSTTPSNDQGIVNRGYMRTNNLRIAATKNSNFTATVTTWRNRIVLSGISSDPQNWFMSAVDDPDDWDYTPSTTVQTQAVAGNNSNAGKCPDLINCLISYNDDLLIMGGDHSIYQMTGDPMAGGQIDLISDITGMAWGEPYCKSPEGIIYFFGSRGGVFQMAPGSVPERLTAKNISDRLTSVDLTSTIVRMVWSDREQGFYLFLTALDGSDSTHYFYDAREGAWWPDKFDSADLNPTSVHIFDGDSASDRVVLLGCRDGYLRHHDEDALADDGSPIESELWFGPVRIDQDMSFIVTELQMKLGNNSSPVEYELWVGDSAEEAFLNGKCRAKGKWYKGANLPKMTRSFGHAAFLRLKNFCVDESWSIEEGMIGYSKCGATRQRNRI